MHRALTKLTFACSCFLFPFNSISPYTISYFVTIKLLELEGT